MGFLVSSLVVRGEDLARLMVTLGLGLLLYEAANRAAWLTGGVDGLSGIVDGQGPRPLRLRSRRASTAFVYAYVVLLLLFLFARRLVSSPFGLSLRGIRENRARMPAIGAPVRRRLVAAFTVGAAIAGVAGALLTQTTQFVGIDVLGFDRSADILIMLVLGGTGRLYGALVGTAVFMVAHDYLVRHQPGVLAVLAGAR